MIRRLSYAVLTLSALFPLTTLSGCGGSGGLSTDAAVVGNPAPPEGFLEQQKAIGGNMMDARSVTAPQK